MALIQAVLTGLLLVQGHCQPRRSHQSDFLASIEKESFWTREHLNGSDPATIVVSVSTGNLGSFEAALTRLLSSSGGTRLMPSELQPYVEKFGPLITGHDPVNIITTGWMIPTTEKDKIISRVSKFGNSMAFRAANRAIPESADIKEVQYKLEKLTAERGPFETRNPEARAILKFVDAEILRLRRLTAQLDARAQKTRLIVFFYNR